MIVTCRDKTAEVLDAHIAMRKRLESKGLPRLGVHIYMCKRFHQYNINTARSVAAVRLSAFDG